MSHWSSLELLGVISSFSMPLMVADQLSLNCPTVVHWGGSTLCQGSHLCSLGWLCIIQGVNMLPIHITLHHPTCSTTFHKCGFSSFKVITTAYRSDFMSFYVFNLLTRVVLCHHRCSTITLWSDLNDPRCLPAAHKGIYMLYPMHHFCSLRYHLSFQILL